MSGPRPDRRYNLLVLKPHDSLEIALETPCASQWQKEFEVQLREATQIRLVPVSPGFPAVTVNLHSGRQWVYFRKIQGRVLTHNLAVVDRNVRHYIGWEKGDEQHLVEIGPNGEVTVL